MADYGFEVKNDDGDYLVSDKTTSLTFVKGLLTSTALVQVFLLLLKERKQVSEVSPS